MQPSVHSSDKHQVEHPLETLSVTPKEKKNYEVFTATYKKVEGQERFAERLLKERSMAKWKSWNATKAAAQNRQWGAESMTCYAPTGATKRDDDNMIFMPHKYIR